LPLSRSTNFGELLGHSPCMRAVFAVLERSAKGESTVLIMGESGTGKELAARGLHERSSRREGQYVVFDCGAVPAALIESQLFGHIKGAFTGASEARPGVFGDSPQFTIGASGGFEHWLMRHTSPGLHWFGSVQVAPSGTQQSLSSQTQPGQQS